MPFNNSIAPGPKDFDVYLAQVSFTEERTAGGRPERGLLLQQPGAGDHGRLRPGRRHDPRRGGRASSSARPATRPASPTSPSAIQPTAEPRVYEDNTGVKSALEAGQIEGAVFDLATAFYIVNVEMEDGVVVGQFPSDPDDQEHFSFVLDLDSPLTDCVNEAILTMGENGELDSIAEEWLADFLDAPQITE